MYSTPENDQKRPGKLPWQTDSMDKKTSGEWRAVWALPEVPVVHKDPQWYTISLFFAMDSSHAVAHRRCLKLCKLLNHDEMLTSCHNSSLGGHCHIVARASSSFGDFCALSTLNWRWPFPQSLHCSQERSWKQQAGCLDWRHQGRWFSREEPTTEQLRPSGTPLLSRCTTPRIN